jgi:hypothetical protein
VGKNNGPESGFLDKLKGKQIGIVFVGDEKVSATTPIKFLRCQLLWVDRYSYGVELPPDPHNRQEMIPKHAVARLFLVEGTGFERG